MEIPETFRLLDEVRTVRFRRLWVPTRGLYHKLEDRDLRQAQEAVCQMAMNDGWTEQWEIPYLVLEHFMSEAWIYWCSTSTTSSTSSDGTWQQWCGLQDDSTSASTTSNTNTIWSYWTATYPPPEVSEEQRIEQEATHNRLVAERQERENKAHEEKKAADVKAIALLRSQLNEEQLANYDLDGSFVVVAGRNNYRLKGASVHELDKNGQPIASLCIHPSWNQNIPMADSVLAKKLLLDADPKEFVKIANRSRMRV
jgi:hypothetical protein